MHQWRRIFYYLPETCRVHGNLQLLALEKCIRCFLFLDRLTSVVETKLSPLNVFICHIRIYALMAGSDIKQNLRKLDFPYCAREALCRIGKTFLHRLPSPNARRLYQFCLHPLKRYYAADPGSKWICNWT